MCEGVAVLVVFSSKSLGVVLAGTYGAFLGTFFLMRQHVSCEILDASAAVWIRALTAAVGWPISEATGFMQFIHLTGLTELARLTQLTWLSGLSGSTGLLGLSRLSGLIGLRPPRIVFRRDLVSL